MQTAPISDQPDSRDSDERTARVLARTLYRELRQNGLEERQILTVATEILALVARDLRDPAAPGAAQAAGTASAG